MARIEWCFLGIIAAVTVGLRIPTITYGLPVFEGADDLFVVQPALEIASLIKPATQFGLPDSTLFYGYGVVFRVVFEVLDVLGLTNGAHPLDDYITYHATWPLMTVRVINIVMTVGIFILLYLCGRKLFSKSSGALAVVLAASSWILLEHTIHARPDLLSAALALGVLYTSLLIIEHSTTRNYVIAGVLVGLSIATKYPLALTGLMIIAAHGTRHAWNIRTMFASRHLWIAGGIALLTFSIATPLFWPLLPRAIDQLRYEARSSHSGADGLSFWGNLGFYTTHVLNYGIGTLVSILAAIGGLQLLVKRRSHALLVLVFPVGLILALSLHGLHWDRWMIPVVPFIALLAGYVITTIRGALSQKQADADTRPRPLRGRGARVSASLSAFGGAVPARPANCLHHLLWDRGYTLGLAIVAVSLIMPPIVRTTRTFNSFRHPETREIAKQWVIENAIPNASVVRESYTPFLNSSFDETLLPSLGVLNDKQLTERNVDYLISNADQRERFFNASDTFPVFIEYYDNNLKASQRVFTARVAPERNVEALTATSDWNIWNNLTTLDAQRGPTIEIYAFSESAKERHAN